MRLDLAYDFFSLLYRNILLKLIVEFNHDQKGSLDDYICKRTSDVLLKYFYFSSYNNMFGLSVSSYKQNSKVLFNCIIIQKRHTIWKVIKDKHNLVKVELCDKLDQEKFYSTIGSTEVVEIFCQKRKMLQAYVGYCINSSEDKQTYYLWKFEFTVYKQKDSLTRFWKIGEHKAKLLLNQFKKFYEHQKIKDLSTSRNHFFKSKFSMIIPESNSLINNKVYFNHSSFREFKSYMGTSIYDYYTWIRLLECLSAILTTSCDIQIIIDQYWHGYKVSFYKKFSLNQPYLPLEFHNSKLLKKE